MFNVLLDPLPEKWNGYAIDTDFQTGIMISQCLADESLSDTERFYAAARLLFLKNCPGNEEIAEAIKWYMTEYSHDNTKPEKSELVIMDWNIDQWRIYAAFRQQYGIDLNVDRIHWFTFMGLLSNLQECAFTRVMDVRQKKITAKMSNEEKAALRKAKMVFEIKQPKEVMSPEEKQQVDEFLSEVVNPILEANKEVLGMTAEITV